MKVVNKLGLIASILGFIPIGLPWMTMLATFTQNGQQSIDMGFYPWGIGYNDAGSVGFLLWPIISVISFMMPCVIGSVLSLAGALREDGRKALGFGAFTVLLGVMMWTVTFIDVIGTNFQLFVEGTIVEGFANLNIGFFVVIAAGILMLLSILLHPPPPRLSPLEMDDIDELMGFTSDTPSSISRERTEQHVMDCTNCGNLIPVEAKFCPRCGLSFGENSQEEE
ncbi:MAG: zinc-ribbon domain-containing protein [Candidatus Hodarchaeota archaeon]